jgi:hypothetical protein
MHLVENNLAANTYQSTGIGPIKMPIYLYARLINGNDNLAAICEPTV